MPPTYRGNLPACLSLLNPYHYLLLAYWIYFRPSALRAYLYRANPELYQQEGSGSVRRSLAISPYRNLYLMMPLLTILLSLPIVLIASWFQNTPVEWAEWVGGMGVGVVVGVAVGMAFGVAIGIGSRVAEGVTYGVVFGVSGGVVAGIVKGIAIGVAGSMVIGIAISMVIGIAISMVISVVISVNENMDGSVVGGVILGMMLGVVGGVIVSMILGVLGGVSVGITGSVAGGIAGGLGALRALFYPYQFFVAFLSTTWKFRHPIEWDEFLVLPLPYAERALTNRLQQDEREGIRLLVEVAQNPFQRWAVQRALCSYLNHSDTAPFHFLYTLPTTALLSVEQKWEGTKAWQGDTATVKQLLLGELVGEWVDIGEWGERWFWNRTQFLRTQQDTPLIRFACLLYDLSYNIYNNKYFKILKENKKAYTDTDLHRYPGGEEITRSFTAIATFLSYQDLSAIASAPNLVVGLSRNDASIRPAVLTALVRLGNVGKEVAAYQASTSRVNQLAALARATEALSDLRKYVGREVVEPERAILRRVIGRWQRLINEVLGKVGHEQTLGPVANPYIAGAPVTGFLFVGREDIMRRLEELWIAEGQSPSVVIYGHRRMGKSSILQNLDQRLGAHTTIIDFNMQRVGYVRNTGELLYYLALALYDTLPAAVQTELAEPNETPFLTGNPYGVFDRFLKKQFAPNRDQQRYLVTIDEFELIEAAIDDGRLEAYLLDFWRGLIQTYPWFVLAFAGLHTLDEMTEDYWNPLFGSVKAIHVGFLPSRAATLLITQPSPDFRLNYDTDAIDSIIRLTNGQPYLIQLICHDLVTRHNRQTFEEGIERKPRFTLADVEVIIDAPEFFRDGERYFTGVWRQAETSSTPAQTTILSVLAPSEKGLPLDTIAQQANLTPPQAHSALQVLVQHDILTEEDGTWHFTVELMRRWAVKKSKR